MKKASGLMAILILLLPALGFSDGLSFRLGYFVPRAQSELWQIEFENMSFTETNFRSATLGLFYEHYFTREISLLIGLDGYSKTELGNYRDYVGYSFDEGDFAFPSDLYAPGDFEITHQFSVSITPIQMSLKLTPFGRRSGLIPYLGGGVSVYFWSVKLRGDMVDFEDEWFYEDPDLGDISIYKIVLTDAREQSRFAFGFHGFAGLMIPFARRMAFEAEVKYSVGKGKLKEAFEGFDDFDLGGFQISFGLNYWF
ncbi:MAG: hypothetical protein AB1715_07075 [Acidobacteriota bacterium]